VPSFHYRFPTFVGFFDGASRRFEISLEPLDERAIFVNRGIGKLALEPPTLFVEPRDFTLARGKLACAPLAREPLFALQCGWTRRLGGDI
jgi:hypothetical protein